MTPLLTATPGSPVTYNPGMAETFSWVPVEGAGRPLFAKATYLTNASDVSISLSASQLNVHIQDDTNIISSLTAPLTSTGTVLAANANRKNMFVQNVGTTPLYVALGSAASSSNFAVILGGGTANGDGNGAAYESTMWTGSVSVSGASPRCIAWEMA